MLSPCVCSSVCPSRWYCTTMAKCQVTQTVLYDSAGTPVFWGLRSSQNSDRVTRSGATNSGRLGSDWQFSSLSSSQIRMVVVIIIQVKMCRSFLDVRSLQLWCPYTPWWLSVPGSETGVRLHYTSVRCHEAKVCSIEYNLFTVANSHLVIQIEHSVQFVCVSRQ